MKRLLTLLCCLALCLGIAGAYSETMEEETMMYLQIGDTVLTAKLADNSSVDGLLDMLAEGPLTLKMGDYAGFEKNAQLPRRLPENNESMNTVPGDIILYQGITLAIYYDTNAWSLTPVGKIQNVTGEDLRAVFGEGDVTVTLSLTDPRAAHHKTLVACFSCTGTTWRLAEYAADYLHADLFHIEPEVPYTDADLAYWDDSCRANREMADDACRPALAARVENMAQYDTVILASPIWWGQAPRIIETFIDAHDLTGKTLAHFCTSGGSSYGRTGDILAAHTDDTVRWAGGKRLASNASSETVAQWLEEIGITPDQQQ